MTELIRILYSEVHAPDRMLVRDVLEKEDGGFQVTEASSRAEFETRLAEGDYDLVLSDLKMPSRLPGLSSISTVPSARSSTGSGWPARA